MRKLLIGVAVLCLLVPALALAYSRSQVRATVVSVDLKNHEITFKYTINEKPSEDKAGWDEKTKWLDERSGEQKDGTESLAKDLKAGSKIYVHVQDGYLEVVLLMNPKEEVK